MPLVEVEVEVVVGDGLCVHASSGVANVVTVVVTILDVISVVIVPLKGVFHI